MQLHQIIVSVLSLIITLFSNCVLSYTVDNINSIGIEERYFFSKTVFDSMPDYRSQYSLTVEPELRVSSDDRKNKFQFLGFYRQDSIDDNRTHGDIRELYWSYETGDVEVLLGVNKVFWGVTESRHLVDVINQTDFVENVDQEDKLGQPMLMLALQKGWGELSFFILPYFREINFPSEDGRLRFTTPIHPDISFYESRDQQQHNDYAFRYSHYISDVDFAFSVFDGTNRRPLFLRYNDGKEWLVPFYIQMRQYGIEAQYTRDAWLWKLESIYRKLEANNLAYVLGFEYTFYQTLGNNFDTGVLFEVLGDDNNLQLLYSPEINKGYFIGTRITPNDTHETEFLLGVAFQKEIHASIFNLEFSRLITNNLKVAMEVRVFNGINRNKFTFESSFEHDDYAQLKLNWKF